MVAHKLDVLRRHCDAVGRDEGEIQKTVLMLQPPLADVDAFLVGAEAYARLGVTEVETMPAGDPVAFITALGDRVVPRLRDIG